MPAQPLTESIKRLTSLRAEGASLKGLPSDAEAPRTAALTALDLIVERIKSTRAAAANLVEVATAKLDTAAQAAERGDLEAVSTELSQLQTVAKQAQQITTADAKRVNDEVGQIASSSASLLAVSHRLEADKAAFDARAASRRAEAADIEKKKWYYLALGPFGLVGLGIMTGLLIDAENRVNEVVTAADGAAKKAQGAAQALKVVRTLTSELQTTQSRLNGVSNAVDIVASDVSGEVSELAEGKAATDPTIARLFLMAARNLIETLKQDAA